MKVLWVGFQPYRRITYPHLAQVIGFFLQRGDHYTLFRERGYFLDDAFRPGLSPKRWAASILTLAFLVADTLRLTASRVFGGYDLVVAVDNFAFVVSAHLFSDVVLWSHDFVTDDQPRANSRIHRWLKRRVENALARHPNLIIQDENRLDLFLARYGSGVRSGINRFLLPVSLPHCRRSLSNTTCSAGSRPLLLQIGGINAWRSMSDRVLAHYQTHHECYELAFHGFIDQAMRQALARAAYLPWVSSETVAAEDVFKVIEKCDVGLVAYQSDDKNFFHIAKASGQLVEYLRCGKPVIAMGNTELLSLVREKALGVAIDSIDELELAIRKIQADYPRYSANCRKLFVEEYDLTRFLEPLSTWLEDVRRCNS